MKILSTLIDRLAFPYSLYLLIKNPDVSGKVKLKAGLILSAVFFYLLNPIAIVANFIPVLGWLDDLLILSIAMALAKKIMPEIDVAELRQKARSHTKRVLFWTLVIFTVLVLIGLCILGLLIYLAVKHWG